MATIFKKWLVILGSQLGHLGETWFFRKCTSYPIDSHILRDSFKEKSHLGFGFGFLVPFYPINTVSKKERPGCRNWLFSTLHLRIKKWRMPTPSVFWKVKSISCMQNKSLIETHWSQLKDSHWLYSALDYAFNAHITILYSCAKRIFEHSEVAVYVQLTF